MSKKVLPSLLDRHWAESILAIGAIVIAAVSLWVAYDTERTNRELVSSERQLVTASSWPFLQTSESDETPDGKPGLSLAIFNGGIGPAKLETFELFWKGKPKRNYRELLLACCAPTGQTLASVGLDSGVGYSSTSKVVLRPGQRIDFIILPRTADNAASLSSLRSGIDNLSFRYCFCSAFDECWLAEHHFGQPRDLNPPRVRACPQPAVSYSNRGL